MFKKIVLVLLALIVALLIYAATQPDSFSVRRSTTINAPAEKIYALIDDFHQWGAWSPWEKLDPTMRRTFGGPPSGKGATYAWEGNSKVGAGKMEITDASAPSKVVIQLDFLKPFEANNVAEFILEPKDGTTDVTWDMHGPMPYVSKLMCIFVSMDKLVGKDFETGLANLKAAAEK